MRLLIIEENRELSASMKAGLEKDGFYVDVSNLGLEGEEKAYVNSYDAILLNLNLPDKDGLEILRVHAYQRQQRKGQKGSCVSSACKGGHQPEADPTQVAQAFRR